MFSLDHKETEIKAEANGSMVGKVQSKKSNLDLSVLKLMLNQEFDSVVLALVLKCTDVKSQKYSEVILTNSPNS